jgi:NitT/TauT family transport system ATP-binding protein
MADDYKIECTGVSHWFRDARSRRAVQAVSKTNFCVREQEFVSIVGPSGCGKTTLLNMIAGLVTPTHGDLMINGAAVKGPATERIGYMFARDTLLPWRTVRKNIGIGLEFARVRDRQAKVEQYISMVGLDGFGDHFPDQLSHGMRQRVALARALIREPEILLMDEPFGALDAQTRLLMQDEFLSLWDKNKSTVVFVTHDLTEAIALSDRVVVFSARPGRIKSEFKIDLERPRRVDEISANPAFQSLYQQIWRDLKVEAQTAGDREHGMAAK